MKRQGTILRASGSRENTTGIKLIPNN